MAQRQRSGGATDESVEVLKDLLIVQLGLAGVPQTQIRTIVGCGMNRVNRIVKHLRTGGQKNGKGRQ